MSTRKKRNEQFAKGYRVLLARWPADGELKMKDEHFRLKDYYEELRLKYERAAARPWLPVKSDRPPPNWPKDVPRTPPQSNRATEQPAPRVRLSVLRNAWSIVETLHSGLGMARKRNR